MKVYLAWNSGDYYGPDPVGNLVYATPEAAMKACSEEEFFRAGGEWKRDEKGQQWRYSADHYYVEEVEVAT